MNLAMNIESKPKEFWKYVNSKIKTHPTIEELCKSTSLHPEIVNLFNDFFSSIFTSEDDFFPVPQTDSFPSIIDTLVITPQIVAINQTKNL